MSEWIEKDIDKEKICEVIAAIDPVCAGFKYREVFAALYHLVCCSIAAQDMSKKDLAKVLLHTGHFIEVLMQEMKKGKGEWREFCDEKND